MDHPIRERLRQALGVYVITDSRLSLGRSNIEVVRQAIAGGARLIQLREKEASTREVVAMGQAILEITREAGALLLVNDRVDVAQAIGADGVHLGQDDLPARLARRILGPAAIIGVTAETEAEARAAEATGADYLGVGPIFPTSTKADAGAPYGTALIGRIKAVSALPVVAIGGIKTENAAEVAQAGRLPGHLEKLLGLKVRRTRRWTGHGGFHSRIYPSQGSGTIRIPPRLNCAVAADGTRPDSSCG